MARVMVLGLGNIIYKDKGLGIYAVRDLYREQWPEGVCFVDRMMLGDIPLDLDGVHGLLVLDAWQAGDSPGNLARLSLDQVQARPELISEPLFWRGLALAEVLGQDVHVVFLGLEAECADCDLSLSPSVQDAYPRFLEAVREEIFHMLNGLVMGRAGGAVWA
ncbi:MAG: hydrogenase maturation protease [Desulfovermiculus sp.]|nr:hydrogenase maturation protease [Desulfovermiculus sp.]